MYERLSRLIREGTPCLFYTDFKGENVHVHTLDELETQDIEFTFSQTPVSEQHSALPLEKEPIPFAAYRSKFDQVIEHIKSGDTYLLNLTQPTPVTTSLTFKEIYRHAASPFKLRVNDSFVCFSPERFITIKGDHISTYPMKGTIDASVHNAEAKILADPKEMAEHIMVVDLLRNDLGIVARDVTVEAFRYIDKIRAGENELLQVSSRIRATLPPNWRDDFATLLKALLPAGSISGTPKYSTVNLIEKIEGYDRGYFTGVFGYFDGADIESAVMIRFIEKAGEQLIYKSGGGITLDSKAEEEYREMLQKIYIS